MAPTAFASSPSASPLQHLSRSLSFLLSRSTDPSSVPPLASIFALIVRRNGGAVPRSLDPTTFPSSDPLEGMDIFHPTLAKRQNYILAIPTTYQGLNDGPAPGAVAGIVLGAIGGFVLILFLVLSLLRLYTGRTLVETKIIERHGHHHHHSRSRSRSRSMSERPARTRRERETTIIEESRVRERSAPPTEVIVEEEHDDIVEVIEEHSPERRGTRRESKRTSGYRTVDPAELGGGSRPMRKVSRR